MSADRRAGDEKDLSDLQIRFALNNQRQDFAFPLGQRYRRPLVVLIAAMLSPGYRQRLSQRDSVLQADRLRPAIPLLERGRFAIPAVSVGLMPSCTRA